MASSSSARERLRFSYERHADQDRAKPAHYPVVIVGAGLVGISAAIDLLSKGVKVAVLEQGDTVSVGSRSICQAKRTLEIWDRLGAAAPMLEEGVAWRVGKVFFGDQQLYEFDLLPESGHKMPAFINLQQYYVDEHLIRRFLALGGEIRWRHRVESVDDRRDHVIVEVDTPGGSYRLTADWVVSAEGVRSTLRRQLGLKFEGHVFDDKFLIVDLRMKADFPSERWFWFNPPFHNGQTVLLHRQAHDLWRMDFQLGPDADPDVEKEPQRVSERIRRMLGSNVDFDLDWISLYVFQCRTLEKYVHGRIIFVGDSAHQVSPFGARGGNAGVQDADNLVWKLKLVLDGAAPAALLDSYSSERIAAARENILHSTRATDFITPKTSASRTMRDATLEFAREREFARPFVNAGRLSVPAHLAGSPLNTKDEDSFACNIAPGSPMSDAPIASNGDSGWLIDHVGGEFTLLYAGAPAKAAEIVQACQTPVKLVSVSPESLHDCNGFVGERYDLTPGAAYLFRPDQHVAARWRTPTPGKCAAALARAIGRA